MTASAHRLAASVPHLQHHFFAFFIMLIATVMLPGNAVAQNPAYQFVKGIGNGDGLTINGDFVKTDAAGNIYVLGRFIGTVDFDPGAGMALLKSTPGHDGVYIAKYDATGNYVLAFAIRGTNDVTGKSFALDGSGNIVVTGMFEGTADFDPGAGTANLTSTGSSDIFVAKYNSSGTYLWAFSIGGTVSDQGMSLALDGSGNVVVTGNFAGTADFDPGAGTANLTSTAGGHDIFVAKYGSSGSYLWAFNVGGTGFDQGTSLALDGSGNIVVTGRFNGTADLDPGAGMANLTSAGNIDIFVAKYNSSGNYLWAFKVGGTSDDFGNCLALDGSDNVFITGSFVSTADFDPGAGTANLTSAGAGDIFVAKYNSSGNYLWAFRIGGSSFTDFGNSLALDGSGNVVVTGAFLGTVDFDPGVGTANLTSVSGPADIFIAKFNPSGDYLWAFKIGGTSSDQGNSLAIDGSGNIVITGFINSSGLIDFDPGAGTVLHNGRASFVAKYNGAGAHTFSFIHDGEGGDDVGMDITVDAAGNLYATGSFSGTVDFDPGAGMANLASASGTDIFVAKYNTSGNYLWAFKVGGTNLSDVGTSLALDGSGNVVVTGSFGGTADFDPGAGTANLTSAGAADIFVAKYNSSGNYLWAFKIGGTSGFSEFGNSLAVDGSGNIAVTGSFSGTADFDPGAGTANLTSSGNFDVFVAKYNSSGNYIWAFKVGGSAVDAGTSLAIDGSDNVVVTGRFSGTADFDPGAGTANLTSGGGSDIFVAGYGATGNYLWAFKIGGTSSDSGNSLALDGSGNVVVTGSFANTADFDPGAGTANLSPVGTNDIFVAKYNSSGAYLWAFKVGSTSDDRGYSLALDGSGNVVLTGYFSGTADFDPGAGTANLTSGGGSDIFVAGYGATGNYLWAFNVGETGADQGNNLAIYGTNVYITGTFVGAADFDPSAATAYPSASGDPDIFIAKYNLSGEEEGTPPELTCPDNISTGNAAGTCAKTAAFTATATGTEPVTITYSHASESSFPVGITTVTVTATNAYGSDECSFTVTVNDAENPSISCAADVEHAADKGLCSYSFTPTPATATDNCPGVSVSGVRSDALALTAPYPVGITTITWTATDAYSHTANCEQTVTISDDEDPTIVCADDVEVSNDAGECGADVTVGPPATDDNCGVASMVNDYNNTADASGYYPIGTTDVVWTVTDIHDNTNSCTQTVTVNDTEDPIALCKNFTLNLSGGTGTVTPNDVDDGSSDVCGIAAMTVEPSTFVCADAGEQTVTLTVTDAAGNSSSCEATVTVQYQPSCSIAVTPSNNTYTGGVATNIYLGYGPQSATITTTATGGSGFSYSWSPTTYLSSTTAQNSVFTPTAGGNYTYTCTVTNSNGCQTTCSVTFCVKDIRDPNHSQKIYLCHNGNTQSIALSSAMAHIAHGDVLGGCSQSCGSAKEIAGNGKNDIEIQVTPNPFAGEFTFSYAGGALARLRILDITGRVVETINFTGPGTEIVLGANLAPGVYFLHLTQGDESRTVRAIKFD